MKHLKTYENINKPQVGDFIILTDDACKTFYEIANKIGILKIVSPPMFKWQKSGYTVVFDSDVYLVNDEDIEYYTKNKKDAEIYLSAKKYNL